MGTQRLQYISGDPITPHITRAHNTYRKKVTELGKWRKTRAEGGNSSRRKKREQKTSQKKNTENTVDQFTLLFFNWLQKHSWRSTPHRDLSCIYETQLRKRRATTPTTREIERWEIERWEIER